MSYKVFANMFFICLFMSIQVNTKPSKLDSIPEKGNFLLKTDNFEISRAFLENSLMQFRYHPGKCVLGAAGMLGGLCFQQEIKEFLFGNREQIFQYGIGALLLTYFFKDKVAAYLPEEEDSSLMQIFLGDNDSSENNIYNFSKSGVRVYRPGEISTRLKDVAGLQTAKEDLSDILMYLKDSAIFENIGAKIPKGVLLSGSPGNGKTLLARAVAGEAQCPFLYVSASEFIEAIVGIGAARVRNMFSIAKELAPCIIFIDEIDAIGRKRSAHGFGGDTELSQTLNQLLSEMDGFEQQENPIVIMGATNRVDVLDTALTRPGRFDRKVEINAPYIKDRCDILQVHLQYVKTANDIDVHKIARGTPGFSGADLAQLVNEAAILAVRNHASSISMIHIDQARDYMTLGRETHGRDIDAEDQWATAVHEAGHALLHVYQKDAIPLYKVTITPRGGANGLTHGMMDRERSRRLEPEYKADIIVSLGGSVAEELVYGGRGFGASSDLKSARKVATEMVMQCGMTQEFKDISFFEYIDAQVHLPDAIATKLQNEVTAIIHECRQEAERILTEHKDVLLKLVQMLLEQGTVFGSDVYKLCGISEPGLEYSLA